jgi:VCBS repeat-containing protein
VTDDGYAVNEDVELVIAPPGVLANDADPNGDALTAVIESGPSHGSLNLNDDGSFSYAPDTNFYGTDSFTYRANDGFLDSEVATVSITVYAVNDAPTITTAAVIDVDENNTAVIDVNATDVEGNEEGAGLIYSLSGGVDATRLTIDLHTGELDFIALPDYENPSDEDGDNIFEDIQITVTDSDGLTDVQDIAVIVHDVNEAPLAVDDVTSTDEDVAVVIDVKANDNDPDGDSMMITGASDPPNGSVAISADGTITYIPDVDFNGIDSFMYTLADQAGLTDTATVTVIVLSPAEQLSELVVQVQILLDDSALNHGQANALTTKLEHIGTALDAGQTRVALNLLAALTNQVTDLIDKEVLTTEEGQPLIDAADDLRDGLENETGEAAIDLALADFGLDEFVM